MFNLWAGGGGEFGTRDTGFRRVRQQFIQPLEADALTSLGGAINGAGDSIANSRRQFRMSGDTLNDDQLGVQASKLAG